MRYGIRDIFNRVSLFHWAIIFLCLFSFVGCRAKKDSSRHESYALEFERMERRIDSVRTMEVVEQKSERSGSETEQSYTRITEYDTTGSVQRISETWRDRRLSNLVTEERDARTVSVSNSEQQISIKDSADIRISETSHTTTDSRPIQGIEWMWVILSVVLITAVILYIIYNRVK